MSEINHKTEIPATSVAPAKSPTLTFTQDELDSHIKKVLNQVKHDAREAAKPKEPDWANVSEKDVYNSGVYIPAIEHELPDYMNIQLKNPEYMVVWANQDQRRIGQLMATGYEMVRPEDIHPDFRLPLAFDSEKNYRYMDVIAMKVHKRILLGKRRKTLQVNLNQLSNRNRPPRVRVKDTFDLAEPVSAGRGAEFYDSTE